MAFQRDATACRRDVMASPVDATVATEVLWSAAMAVTAMTVVTAATVSMWARSGGSPRESMPITRRAVVTVAATAVVTVAVTVAIAVVMAATAVATAVVTAVATDRK